VLDLGVTAPPGSEPLPITSSQMTHLWNGLCSAYRILGFESAAMGDNVFRDLVLARIIEPTSKIDAERVLTEVGVEPASYADAGDGFRGPGFSNYAEVVVMPRSWWLWWCSCCSTGLSGVTRAA
jgi:hypothetical protein